MPSLLEGALSKAIFAGFKGKLLKGSFARSTPGGGLDALGDPITPTTATYKFEGFEETVSVFFRAQAGIPDKDAVFMIFTDSIRPRTDVRQQDVVTLRGAAWRVVKVLAVDPAQATYKLHVTPA